jgi:protoporphyrin/coproporphyrin ferrochelatase
MTKRAVVLFNLGGPDRPEAVAPFLYNLFSDPAVISLPAWLRLPIARLAASRRAKIARDIYRRLGGGSPIRANTEAQAAVLEKRLGPDYRVFIAMRYWHPMSAETVAAVKEWRADSILLLPLYPQFSTTSTNSSVQAWRDAARLARLTVPTRAICCYPTEAGFVAAAADEVRKILARWPPGESKRILFSAHGLPGRVVAKGDPYTWQAAATVDAIRAALAASFPVLDSVLCYQSRVGPLKWIGPSIDDEIRRAGAGRVGLLVVPIAFVSEHSETLIELDQDYRHLAGEVGVPTYVRAPTVSVADAFIGALARLVALGFAQEAPIASGTGGRLCPRQFSGCPCLA